MAARVAKPAPKPVAKAAPPSAAPAAGSSTPKPVLATTTASPYDCRCCYEAFCDPNRIPKLLSCCHIVCSSCLLQLWAQNSMKGQDSEDLCCPVCSQKFFLPEGGVDALPTHLGLLSAVKSKAPAVAEQLCTACKAPNRKPAVSSCEKCSAFFCRGHNTLHEDDHPDHLVSGVSPQSALLASNAPCPVHTGRVLDVFCEDCHEVVCSMCAATTHRTHISVMPVSEAFTAYTQSTEAAVQIAKAHLGKVTASISAATEMMVHVKDRGYAVEGAIDTTFEVFVQLLAKRRDELTQQARNITENKLSALTKQVEELQQLHASVLSTCDFLAPSSGTSQASFLLVRPVLLQLTNCLSNCLYPSEPITDQRLMFEVDENSVASAVRVCGQLLTSAGTTLVPPPSMDPATRRKSVMIRPQLPFVDSAATASSSASASASASSSSSSSSASSPLLSPGSASHGVKTSSSSSVSSSVSSGSTGDVSSRQTYSFTSNRASMALTHLSPLDQSPFSPEDSKMARELYEAAALGKLQELKTLAARNRKIVISSACNTARFTPVHIAAHNGHLQCVHQLVLCGADINSRSACKWTPLHTAALNGHLDVVEYLIKHNSDVSARDYKQWTPLHIAASKARADIVRALLAHANAASLHTELNSPDDRGYTPLHLAALSGNMETVDVLVAAGADKSLRNTANQLPVSLVNVARHAELVQLLA